MQIVTGAWAKPKLKKYNIALLVLTALSVILRLTALLWHSAVALLLLPLEAAAISALCMVAIYRLALSRHYSTALASFTSPIILALSCPVYMSIMYILLRLTHIDGAGAGLRYVLAAVMYTVYPIAALALSITAVVRAIMHCNAAQYEQSKIIKYTPLAVSLGGGIVSAVIAVLLFININRSLINVG